MAQNIGVFYCDPAQAVPPPIMMKIAPEIQRPKE